MQNTAKVGGLVLAFFAMLAGAYVVLGRSLFPEPRDRYFAEMPNAGGIAKGTKALLAGVEVGTVSQIELKSPNVARLTLDLVKGTRVPEGSEVVIPGSFISFGMAPVEIVPPAKADRWLEPGATMPGKRGSPLDTLLPDAKNALGDVQGTLSELKKTLQGAQKWLNDDKLRGSLTQLMETSEQAVAKISRTMESVVAENRPALNQIVRTVADTTREIQKGTKLVVQLIEKGEFQKEGLALLRKFNESADKANTLLADVGALLNDPSLKASLTGTLDNVKTISDSGVRIAESGEKIAENTAVVTEKAVGLADEAGELLKDVRSAVQSVNGFLDRAAGAGKGLPRIETTMDLSRDIDRGLYQTDFLFEFPLQGNRYRFGIFDAFEKDLLVAQIGKEFRPGSSYFYGVYAGKPGIGVSSQVAPRWSASGDFFDLNKPRLDLRLRYDFGGGINAWAGINDALGGNRPAVGIGIRR